MKANGGFAAVLMALALAACSSTPPPSRAVDVVQRIVLSSGDSPTPSRIAAEVAAAYPVASRYRKYPQIMVLGTGTQFRTGVVANANGNKVEIYYQNTRVIPNDTPSAANTIATLTVLSVSPNTFEIRSSPLVQHLSLFTGPLDTLDALEKDMKDSLSRVVKEVTIAHDVRAEAVEARRIQDEKYAAINRARDEASAQDRRQREGEAVLFRRKIIIGTETNCGPVINVKADLVQIYHPVPNYGNEHWVRRDEVFGPYINCRFENGKYVSPK